jgi:hypothetical protein
MTLHEPATLLTDYLLSALGAGLAWRLRRGVAASNLAVVWWSRTLALTGLSAFVAGTYHGFAPNFEPTVSGAWWIVTLLLVNLVSAAMAMSLLHEHAGATPSRAWRALIALKFLTFAAIAVLHPVFVVVIVDYGLTMLGWLAAALAGRRPWRGWILAGIGLSVIAAIVQQARLAPSPRFNHNDLYHVLQALALMGLYGGGRLFGAHGAHARAA